MPKNDQGVVSERYKIIPRTLIFITKGTQVLLLKGAPTKRLWANRYNGIGGHIERSEDVLSAAKREIEEETGLLVDSLWLCGCILVDASDITGIGIFVFKGITERDDVVPSKEGKLEWIDFDKIDELPLVEDLPVILPKLLAMKTGDTPFFARYYYDEHETLRIVFG